MEIIQLVKICLTNSLISFFLFFCFYCSLSFSAYSNLRSTLENEIESQKKASFESLLQKWESLYGENAFSPLVEIASDHTKNDKDRYIAIMAATHLKGKKNFPELSSFLKDSSWMMRSAALKSLSLLNDFQLAKKVIPLIHDPALVVRIEAIETLKVLQPQGTNQALIHSLFNVKNYANGKALWVPQKALAAILYLNAKEAIPSLKKILKDPRFQTDKEYLNEVQKTLDFLSHS